MTTVPEVPAPTASEGRWATRPVLWYAPDQLYCTACGAMLHRDYWISDPGGAPYCSPACEALEARVAVLYARWDAAHTKASEG